MTFPLRQILIPMYILACLLLGGSSLPSWSNMVLQLGAVGILGWAALARPRLNAGRPGSQLAVILIGIFALFGLQLIPLPPDLWSVLPARHAIVHGFNLLELRVPWLPISLAPYATLTSALWLLPPLAVLAGVLRLDAYREKWVALAVLFAALVGVTLGALQLARYGVVGAGWYLYPITDQGLAVGFFANANHMAILLVSAIPFVVALYQARGHRRSTQGTRASAGTAAILVGSMIALLVGIALSGSRAGYGLGVIAFLASAFLRTRVNAAWARWGLAVVGLGAFLLTTVMLTSPVNNNPTATGADGEYSPRSGSLAKSAQAVKDYFPFGSGIGTFSAVYPSYEDPDRVDRRYLNHVHNDYVEVALETGIFGILLMGAFVIWWTQRCAAIWQGTKTDQFARAATIASASILLHSLADFPLRTTAISVVFAACIAMMVGVRRRPKITVANAESITGARHLSVEAC